MQRTASSVEPVEAMTLADKIVVLSAGNVEQSERHTSIITRLQTGSLQALSARQNEFP